MGGAENVLHALALGLRDRWEVEAASLLPAGPVARRLEAAGVPVHDLALRSKLAAPLAAARVARLCASAQIAVVQSFLFHANLVARGARLLLRAAGRRGPAIVSSIHLVERDRPLRGGLERATARLADRVVCVSAAIRRDLGVARDRRFVVIRNGIAVAPGAPGPRTASPGGAWTSVGRLHPQKGHDVLIEAWRRLGPTAPPLRIAGAGPLEAELRERARGLPVELLGPRDDVASLLATSSGFVLASRDEGLPLAVLEAMAAGLPIVTTAVGGIPEALASGRDAILVPPGDPGALAEAVRSIDADPGLAAMLGAAAQARVAADFSERGMVDRYDALYRALTGRRTPSASSAPP